MAKSTNAEVEQRVSEVFRLLVNGTPGSDIVHHVSEKHDVTERQARNYVKRATEQITEIARFDRVNEFGRAIAQLNSLYAASIKLKDYRTALSVRRELTALLKLTPPPQPAPVPDLTAPADLLGILAQELGNMQGDDPDPERARVIQGLVTAGVKVLEVSELADRISTLEDLIRSNQA